MCKRPDPTERLFPHDVPGTENGRSKPSSCAECRLSRLGCPGSRQAKILALEEREGGARHG